MQCNPFDIDKLTAVNNTNVHFDNHVYRSISKIKLTGKEQCLAFIKKRLVNQEVSIDTKISKNNFSPPGCPEKGASKVAGASVMKINSTILIKLRSCVSYRRNELSQIFSSEVDGVSQCLSLNNDEHNHGNKADILKKFDTVSRPLLVNNHSCMILALSALVKSHARSSANTFNDYASFMVDKILKLAGEFDRINVITDRYFKNILKKTWERFKEIASRRISIS